MFASFVCTMGLSWALDYYTSNVASGRYLFPVLVAWCATAVTPLLPHGKRTGRREEAELDASRQVP